jgi:hypothetical protein
MVNLEKVKQVQSYLENLRGEIGKIKYRIIIINNSYFFFVDKNYVQRCYEGNHRDLKGWYAGVLSLYKEDSGLLYIIVSEIFYKHSDMRDLFFKIFYQMVINQNPDILKLKYKKLRKIISRLLSQYLKIKIDIDPMDLDKLLNNKDEILLSEKAEVIIPHMSLINLLEKKSFNEDISYIKDVKSHLEPNEYMLPKFEKDYHLHKHKHD